jgi:hypothetical protein
VRIVIGERIGEYNVSREPGEPEMTQRRVAEALNVTEGAVFEGQAERPAEP